MQPLPPPSPSVLLSSICAQYTEVIPRCLNFSDKGLRETVVGWVFLWGGSWPVRGGVGSYHAVQRRVGELRIDVREAGELALVDVGDHHLVRRGQHGLRAREELVKVFCSLAALK